MQERAPLNALETAGRRLPYVLMDLLGARSLATSGSRLVLLGDRPAFPAADRIDDGIPYSEVHAHPQVIG